MCAGYFLVLLDVTIVNVALALIGAPRRPGRRRGDRDPRALRKRPDKRVATAFFG
jgi:hypothetical protein